MMETLVPEQAVSSSPVGQDMLLTTRDHVAFLTFNRPAARNALTFAMYKRLAALCAELAADDSIRAMVLTGAGSKAFSAGTDINEFSSFETAEDALAYEARIEQVLSTLERCRIPTIAAIAGFCTGGGAAIAGCCDIRIAASSAKFGFPIARTLGNCLSFANYARFAAIVGPARMKDMIFTARMVDADEALRAGLVSEVVGEVESLLFRAEELARLIAGHAPLTLQATKEALRKLGSAIGPAEGEEFVIRCYTSEDFREGRQAFRAKRSPVFKGC